ncbi:COX15/CtaA family protein [Fodinibius sediminis]|uniref:Cytochrome c oxidase assembly protein subunit 15 n=1 Tax=Fodinibius sediminis TaxID=1214077 RepID=A0A521BLD0_9BACT|nr:COX15/CtaA family protein [Fodinibius sediminis]SMO47957.1 cytochrome c oxidase assembly protein subunit 15 [Fodinibius sediminis]
MQPPNNQTDRYVAVWLWTGVALIFMILIIGGITRLTDSGLSMSDWSLVMGAFPPMNESEWLATFEQYRQFPQYQQLNAGMSLTEFKAIFFWEYLHRLLGRVIGLVFLLPFLFFWLKGYFSRRMLRRAAVLFGMGALQGIMGWIMVKSGLVDVPYVSHYRLAVHLLLAIVLISLCAWYALDLNREGALQQRPETAGVLKNWALLVGVAFFLQIVWGGFTAGLDAGYIYNTFPLMNGQWLPLNAWALQPAVINFLENPGMVQFTHRLLGTLLSLLVIVLWWRTRSFESLIPSLKRKADLLLILLVLQYLLGIATVLWHVPLVLGVMHQAGAVLFWIGWLFYYHHLQKKTIHSAKLTVY